MGGEGGEVLGDGLFVADVCQHLAEHGEAAVVGRRDVKPALGHQHQQADGFEGDRLAAGVGSGDNQRVEGVSQRQVVCHRSLRVQQGMAGFSEGNAPPGELRLGPVHPQGELGPRENTVQQNQQVVVEADVLLESGAVGGELGEDALDLLLLPGLELPQLVVGLHNAHGLDKEGAARPGHVVDQAGDLVLAFGLHRHNEAVVALGNNGVLQVPGLRGGEQLIQYIPYLTRGGPDVTADGGEFCARRVGDLVLAQNGICDLILQKAVGLQGAEEVTDNGCRSVALSILLGGAGRAKDASDVQQLPGVQGAAHIRALEGGRHRLHVGKGGGAPQGNHVNRRGGLKEPSLHVVPVGTRPYRQTPLLALPGHRLGGKQLQNFRQFKRPYGFFKQFTHGLTPKTVVILHILARKRAGAAFFLRRLFLFHSAMRRNENQSCHFLHRIKSCLKISLKFSHSNSIFPRNARSTSPPTRRRPI
ncbi:hypothetical protein SDC9_81868 [bioreactor metagenome]|uniref:Uncharacterized protein n=1 Tax=bioreactor metagenome TaxID=1076179 RepID=A0A644Z4S9_9ZZZZ